MKKLSFLLVGLFVLSLAACSSDDDSSSSSSGSINGEWTITAFNFDGQGNSSGMAIDFSGEAIDLDGNDKVNFHDDNTFTSDSDGFTLKMTIDFMGQETTQEVPVDPISGDGTWSKDGNTLTIDNNNSDGTLTYEIQTLNSTTLKMVVNDFAPLGDALPGGGEGNSEAIMTLKR